MSIGEYSIVPEHESGIDDREESFRKSIKIQRTWIRLGLLLSLTCLASLTLNLFLTYRFYSISQQAKSLSPYGMRLSLTIGSLTLIPIFSLSPSRCSDRNRKKQHLQPSRPECRRCSLEFNNCSSGKWSCRPRRLVHQGCGPAACDALAVGPT